jgi:predicted permease
MNGGAIPERLFRTVMRALPSEFIEAHGSDAAELFSDLYREALRRGGVTAALRVWLRSTGGLVICVFGEHLDERRQRRQGRAANRWDYTLPPKKRDPRKMIEGMKQDLGYAFRTLRRSPGFALAAILILGVGIGATTTIFSVVDTVMLRPLPFPDPDELVHVDNSGHTIPDFIEWRDNMESFSAIGAAWESDADLSYEGTPDRLSMMQVTEGFLPMLGAQPYLGRLFMSDDFVGDASVVLLDHGLWQRRFGSDPSVIGRRIHLSGQPAVVAGVVDPRFGLSDASAGWEVDVWVPLDENRPELQRRNYQMLDVIARLREGVGREAAQAEMDALMAGVAEEFPEQYTRRDGTTRTFPLVPLHQALVRAVSGILYVVLGAVGFMLLIACANVANLFLARGTARTREIALRGALGAGRIRLIGQLLTESTVLALAGGVLGVGLAFFGVELFARYDPGRIPRLENLAVDTRILLFALVASGGTGILCGIFPALQAVRRDVNDGLREGTSNASAGRERRRMRSGLVVSEIALTLILLTGAGLLFRSFVGMIQVDPGFQTEELVTVPLSLEGGALSARGGSYSEEGRAQFVRDLMARLEGLPGVRQVAAGWDFPFRYTGGSRCCWGDDVVPEGSAEEDPNAPRIWVRPITDGYFEALGGPLAHGREFTSSDVGTDPFVAVLNAPLARHLFGRTNVAGERVRIGESGTFTVVGVAEGIHHFGLDQEVEPSVYVPYERFGTWTGMLSVMVRSEAGVGTLAPAIREAIWAVDSDLPIEEMVMMRQRVDRSISGPRFLSILFGFFAGVALLLACGGIYASMLYSVGQRRREMGIRLALGADGMRVIRLVLGQGLALTVVGLGLGLAGAWGLTRYLGSIIWGVTATDPVTFTAVTLLLASVAAAACLVPAWRASRADPLETLRAE